MLKITYTLFYSTSCGHCVVFKPKWNDFKTKLRDLQNSDIVSKSKLEVEVKTYEYEGSDIPEGKDKINGKEFMGVPTVKVEVDNGNKHFEFEYDGKRDATDMFEFTLDIIKQVSEKKAYT